jgi:metal-responsive CopG/Arc/MetJ family transcriptional regulator
VKAGYKNVTLSLPEPLLQKFRVYAARYNQSMTELMERAIRKMIAEDTEGAYQLARKKLIEGMRNARPLGTGGKITWTREELHER